MTMDEVIARALRAPARGEERGGPWERCLAAIYEPFLALGERLGMAARRQALVSRASGRVLEIGAGTGLNLAHYPETIEELVLAEPSEPMARRLERRLRGPGATATLVRAPAEALPFPDASFDTVVSTMVLCTVEHPAQAIAEARRVLRPGGRLLFLEHVRSSAGPLAWWQDRLERPWRAFAVGCRCNRRTVEGLRAGGFSIEELRGARWRGMPPIVTPLAVGVGVA
jgi:SAM-dependent methyltransferase